jgi:hypothetical protein
MFMQKPLATVRNSPLLIVLIIGSVVLAVLLLRGLDFGPLHTDLEVMTVWAETYNFSEFVEKYHELNQRHLLGGPRNALAIKLFGTNMLPYNTIFAISRVLEGALLAGILYQVLKKHRLFALCAGLALTLSPVRLPQFYQSIYWGIETTLVLTLAAIYAYIMSLQQTQPRLRWRWYGLSFVLYALAVLSYEANIPWLGVQFLLGWYLLTDLPWRQRFSRLAKEALPFGVLAIVIVFLVLFVFEPWNDLAPSSSNTLPARIIEQLSTAVSFPLLYIDRLRVSVHEGYAGLVVLLALFGGAAIWGVSIWFAQEEEHAESFWSDVGKLLLLAGVMVFAATLVGTSNPDTREAYRNRITFGRSVGIAVMYTTLVFGAAYAVRRVLGTWHIDWRSVGALAMGVGLIGPGFAFMLVYQSIGQSTEAEIDNLKSAVIDVRCLFRRPLYMVIVTEPDWVGARIPDANDWILRETQRALNDAQADVTIDILKAGNAGHEDDFIPVEGTCDLDFASGMCLNEDSVRASRWAMGEIVANEDIVVVYYANDGTLTLAREIDIRDLDDYNIATAGPNILTTNEERFVLPVDQMPVPLSGHCPD